MKRYSGVIFILICGFCGLTAFPQNIPTYKIPSFDVKVEGGANFIENINSSNSNQAKEKRQVNVQVKSTSGKENCDVSVWVYTLDHTTFMGPYVVRCNGSLRVDVDQRPSGVLVESDEKVFVDVWIDESE